MTSATQHAEAPLTNQEAERLAACEAEIAEGLGTFVKVGRALRTIRDERLYRTTASTFEEYLRKTWDMSRPYAYQVIDAQGIHDQMSAIADKPRNEGQARALAKVPEDQREKVFKEASRTGDPTAQKIKEAARHLRAVPEPAPAPEPTDPYEDRVGEADMNTGDWSCSNEWTVLEEEWLRERCREILARAETWDTGDRRMATSMLQDLIKKIQHEGNMK